MNPKAVCESVHQRRRQIIQQKPSHVRNAIAILASELKVPALLRMTKANVADLICADPFSLDGPRSVAPVIWLVASEMTVLDQATSCMAAEEVDDFVLCIC